MEERELAAFLARWERFETASPQAAADYVAERPKIAAKIAAARAQRPTTSPRTSPVASANQPTARPVPLPPPDPPEPAEGADPSPLTAGQKWGLAAIALFALSFVGNCLEGSNGSDSPSYDPCDEEWTGDYVEDAYLLKGCFDSRGIEY